MFSRSFDIAVEELKNRMENNAQFLLLDIREPFEYEICRLPGAKLIPMGEIQNHLNELNNQQDIIVYCHAGIRSARVVAWLHQKGFTNAKNLAGGIDAWSCQIDPNVPRY